MSNWLTNWVPVEGLKIVLVLFLSFLVGLEREERYRRDDGPDFKAASFGGVRTFPLIGLIGYALTLLSGGQLLLIAAGFLGVAAFLLVFYWHKLEKHDAPGVTTETSGLLIYVVGALVARDQYWIATTVTIIALLLLELKVMLEDLSQRLPEREILTFTKFLVLAAVILPIVPNRIVGPFGFNPFKAWLIVVAASAISYASYILQLLTRGSGVFLSAVLGGAYSSTVTTIVLAKRARDENSPGVYAGGILVASGAMYFRILVLVGLFSGELVRRLLPAFLSLGVAGILGGWLWSRLRPGPVRKEEVQSQNPLALSSAFFFVVTFTVLLAATHYATIYFGNGGVYGLAGLSGLVDITPFILGLTQSSAAQTTLATAAAGIVIAAASNNFVKGLYALGFGGRKGGMQAMWLLWALTALGLLPLLL